MGRLALRSACKEEYNASPSPSFLSRSELCQGSASLSPRVGIRVRSPISFSSVENDTSASKLHELSKDNNARELKSLLLSRPHTSCGMEGRKRVTTFLLNTNTSLATSVNDLSSVYSSYPSPDVVSSTEDDLMENVALDTTRQHSRHGNIAFAEAEPGVRWPQHLLAWWTNKKQGIVKQEVWERWRGRKKLKEWNRISQLWWLQKSKKVTEKLIIAHVPSTVAEAVTGCSCLNHSSMCFLWWKQRCVERRKISLIQKNIAFKRWKNACVHRSLYYCILFRIEANLSRFTLRKWHQKWVVRHSKDRLSDALSATPGVSSRRSSVQEVGPTTPLVSPCSIPSHAGELKAVASSAQERSGPAPFPFSRFSSLNIFHEPPPHRYYIIAPSDHSTSCLNDVSLSDSIKHLQSSTVTLHYPHFPPDDTWKSEAIKPSSTCSQRADERRSSPPPRHARDAESIPMRANPSGTVEGREMSQYTHPAVNDDSSLEWSSTVVLEEGCGSNPRHRAAQCRDSPSLTDSIMTRGDASPSTYSSPYPPEEVERLIDMFQELQRVVEQQKREIMDLKRQHASPVPTNTLHQGADDTQPRENKTLFDGGTGSTYLQREVQYLREVVEHLKHERLELRGKSKHGEDYL